VTKKVSEFVGGWWGGGVGVGDLGLGGGWDLAGVFGKPNSGGGTQVTQERQPKNRVGRNVHNSGKNRA